MWGAHIDEDLLTEEQEVTHVGYYLNRHHPRELFDVRQFDRKSRTINYRPSVNK